jgi:hypothetical protein
MWHPNFVAEEPKFVRMPTHRDGTAVNVAPELMWGRPNLWRENPHLRIEMWGTRFCGVDVVCAGALARLG